MKLQAGALDRRISILSPTKTRSSVGQTVETWSVTATIYAQRLELRAADLLREAGTSTDATGRYLIRYRPGITNSLKVKLDDGLTYDIIAVDEPDRRRTLVLTVRATGPVEVVTAAPTAPVGHLSVMGVACGGMLFGGGSAPSTAPQGTVAGRISVMDVASGRL